MDPLISIHLHHAGRVYQPRARLVWDCQIDAVDASDIVAVETSVLWYTEGKGDEDLAVHSFDRRVPSDVVDGDLRTLRRMECELPATPLSYHGLLFRIRWCVRVRVFLKGGRDLHADEIFQIGQIPAVAPRPEPESQPEVAAVGAE
jgi:hypothetical protein